MPTWPGSTGGQGAEKQCRRKGLGFEPRFGERHIAVTQVAPRAASHAHAALFSAYPPSDDDLTFSTSPRVRSCHWCGPLWDPPVRTPASLSHVPSRSRPFPYRSLGSQQSDFFPSLSCTARMGWQGPSIFEWVIWAVYLERWGQAGGVPPWKLVSCVAGSPGSSRGRGGCSEGFRSSIAFEELGCAIVVDARPFTSRRDVVICGLMCRSVYKSFALRFTRCGTSRGHLWSSLLCFRLRLLCEFDERRSNRWYGCYRVVVEPTGLCVEAGSAGYQFFFI